MKPMRRWMLKAAGAAAAALVLPLQALAAWNKEAFQSKTAAGALKGLGVAGAAESADLVLEAPQIAENGAVVPIEVTSNIAGTRAIAVVIDKNPFPLVAKFDFADGAAPYVRVNVKIGESSFVRAYAEAGGKYFTSAREVKVTIGGCGG